MEPKLKEKSWDLKRELELLETWDRERDSGLSKGQGVREGKVLVIDTPPPYMSGRPHIGQFATYAQMDMIARFHRMRGYTVIFPWYADRNGLPVEVEVEKRLGKRMQDVPREEFLRLCKAQLDEYEREWVKVLRRWGISAEYIPNGTDSVEYRTMTQATFIEMWNRGLIYEAERPTIWCPRCMTALAEPEVEYREEDTHLNYIKFKVKETGEDLIIATTRPELLAATVAVAYNPEDERYGRLRGMHAIVPLFNQEVPIIPHQSVKKEFGTGVEMISTFGDTRDLAIVNELRLPIRIVVTQDGKLKGAGKYDGLGIRETRERIVKDLEAAGLLVKREPLRHTVPVCWRCKTPIEIIVTREYFVKQLEFKDKLLKVIEDMKFTPPEYKKMLTDWVNSLEFDWPISRRRYYGTEIPIWYCVDDEGNARPILPNPGRYYRPWVDEPPSEVKEKCRGGRLIGEDRILDTWFDSSISWMYASGYTRDKSLFNAAYPDGIVRPQGYEIIRTWLYYSVLRAMHLFGKPPFRYVRINGMGLDEKGEAMHKSKGNVIDSLAPAEKYGADAVRFWAAVAGRLGYDFRYSEHVVKTGKDFTTKLWNIARFISQFPEVNDGYELTYLDRLILNELNRVARVYIDGLSGFDTYEPTMAIYEFLWHIFADHYIEAVKSRAYNRDGAFTEAEQRGAWFTLHRVLDYSLRMLAPIMPFITDAIWRGIHGRSIHGEFINDPEGYDEAMGKALRLFMNLNSSIWGFKNKMRLSLAERLNAVVYAQPELEPLKRELESMHKVSFSFTKPPSEAVNIGEGIYILMPKS